MAIRFDAATERISATTNVVSYDSNYTFMAWVYVVTHGGAGNGCCVISIDDQVNDVDEFYLEAPSGSTLRVAMVTLASGTPTGTSGSTTFGAGSWQHVAVVRSANNLRTGYLNGVSEFNHTTSVSGRTTPTTISLGSVLDADPLNGRMAYAFLYTAALTQAEILQQMYRGTPVRTADLNRWSPFILHTDVKDYSGNGYDWTATGTLSTEDGPPVSWGGRSIFPLKAAGGTTYNESPSGGLTPSGAIFRDPRKVFAGGITPAGVILRSSTKTAAGSITPTGAPTKQTAKTFAGGLTPSGVLAAAKTALVSLAGSITPTGALIRQAGKTVAGSITPTGAMFRDVGKVVAGSITPTGALIRSIGKILAGALTPSGGLSSSKSNSAPSIVSGYTEAGNASNSTTLVINTPTHADGDKIYIVYVTDADSPTTASVSGTGWSVLEGPQDVSSSSVSTAGVMYVWYKTAASEGGSYTITASNSERAVAIAFAVHGDNGIDAEATYAAGTDTSAEVGAVTTTVANTLRISVVVSQGVRTVSTLTNHTLLATHSYTSAGTISVQYKTVASAGVDSGQTATLDTGGWGSHAWAIKPSTGNNYTASLSGALAPAGAIFRTVGKTVAGSITPTGAAAKAITKTFAGTLTPAGAVAKQTAKLLAGALTPIGTIARSIGKVLAGALGLSGALTRSGESPDPVDVTLSDAAVTVLTLGASEVTTLTLGDSEVTAVVLTDGTT